MRVAGQQRRSREDATPGQTIKPPTRGHIDMHHLDLIRAWICVASLTFAFVLAFAIVFSMRRRWKRSNSFRADALPDFAIVDCGESIHLVPIELSQHKVDN